MTGKEARRKARTAVVTGVEIFHTLYGAPFETWTTAEGFDHQM